MCIETALQGFANPMMRSHYASTKAEEAKHLERLRFIQRVQHLGFHLEEIHELLEVEKRAPCVSPRAAKTLERFIGQIDEKASALSDMRAALAKLRADAQHELDTESRGSN